MDKMDLQAKTNAYQIMGFNELTDYYGILDSQILSLLEIDKRTLKAWRRKNDAPVMAKKLITLYKRGFLTGDWEGFRVDGDTLSTPIGQFITSGEIMGTWYNYQIIERLKVDNRLLVEQVERLKQQLNADFSRVQKVELFNQLHSIINELDQLEKVG